MAEIERPASAAGILEDAGGAMERLQGTLKALNSS